jgi:hypothetical protein
MSFGTGSKGNSFPFNLFKTMQTFNTNRLRNYFRDAMQEGIAPISDAEFSRIVRAFQYLTKRIIRK